MRSSIGGLISYEDIQAACTYEDGDGGLVEIRDKVDVARALERGIATAPTVGVEAEEVGRGVVVVVVALQVGPGVLQDIADVGG